MKIRLIHFALVFPFLVFLYSFDNSEELSAQGIKCGTAKVTGRIKSHSNDISEKRVWFTVTCPVTGTFRQTAMTDKEGNFSFEVDTETELSLCSIASDINLSSSLLVMLKNNGEAKIEIVYNKNGDIEDVELTGGVGQSKSDILYTVGVTAEAIFHRSDRPRESLYDKSFDYFLNDVENVVQLRRNLIYADPRLSEGMKNYSAKDLTLFLYDTQVFDYVGTMHLNYMNTNDGKTPPDSLDIQTPPRRYYAFLKRLNLNDPLCLYCSSLPELIAQILRNETLGIPQIEGTPVDIWLEQVKAILSDLVGFDDGIFYDILIGNAYARQLNNESRPLSGRQIENIRNYYKGGEMEKILLRKNKEVLKLAEEKGAVVVNDVPEVPGGEQLMNAVISKYMGKTVVVDLWATWCAPCIQAMKESRGLKKELMGRDVVFVYITNPSSPKKLWEEQINGVGGEHYYFSGDEWKSVMDSFGLDAIPSYLIYDASGKLRHKFTGYQGNDSMRKMITDLLK